jgi:hypothetical protein
MYALLQATTYVGTYVVFVQVKYRTDQSKTENCHTESLYVCCQSGVSLAWAGFKLGWMGQLVHNVSYCTEPWSHRNSQRIRQIFSFGGAAPRHLHREIREWSNQS